MSRAIVWHDLGSEVISASGEVDRPTYHGDQARMNRSEQLSTLSEREWVAAWDKEQESLDLLKSRRGSWLPNVVEVRHWGALRWTTGRPGHASSSGQAVAETFAVLRPGLADKTVQNDVLEALRERPPARRILGFGFREYHIRGAALGAVAGGVVAAAAAAIARLDSVVVLLVALAGLGIGLVIGTAIVHAQDRRARKKALSDSSRVRIVTGRFAPDHWFALVAAATTISGRLGNDQSDIARQTRDDVHQALWEGAGVVLTSSDHTGIEVLAERMQRLAASI